MSNEELLEIIRYNNFDVTFTGGDPMFQVVKLTELAKHIKQETDKTIWCYTGYTWEAIANREPYKSLLQYIDVLVDGPFVLDKRDISLIFRGSSNQRIIDVKRSYEAKKIVLYEK